jgi:hypothetical protein
MAPNRGHGPRLLPARVEIVGELTILMTLSEGARRRGQPHRVRPPLALGALRVPEAYVLVAGGVLFVPSVGQLAGDDRRGEVVRVVVDRRFPDAGARVPDVESYSRRSSRRRPISPMSCILQGKSSACWSIVMTRALLSVSLIAFSPDDHWTTCPTTKSHHCHSLASSDKRSPTIESHPVIGRVRARSTQWNSGAVGDPGGLQRRRGLSVR